jgi:ABC-type Fe3+/spermidine/putrescine transport system ATPase subunit
VRLPELKKIRTDTAGHGASPEPVELVLRGLSKRYGSFFALKRADLRVAGGEFLTVLGPSGSGKTTLLRLIAGFADPTEGELLIGGQDVSRMPPSERNVGVVPQGYALFPHMSAEQNIGYGLKMRGWSKAESAAQVERMLELVRLGGLGHRRPRELSGGQQQRVALARALAFGPSVLLMDEPLGALDRELRVQMAGELRRVHAEMRTTVIYVTHDREEALTLSDRIAIMHDGEIDAVDTPDNLYNSPRTAFVAGFFGAHNLVPVKVLAVDAEKSADPAPRSVVVELFSRDVRVKTWSENFVEGSTAKLALPPSAVAIAQNKEEPSVRVDVIDVLYFGDVLRVVCGAPGLDNSLTFELPSKDAPITAGMSLDLSIDGSRLVLVQ